MEEFGGEYQRVNIRSNYHTHCTAVCALHVVCEQCVTVSRWIKHVWNVNMCFCNYPAGMSFGSRCWRWWSPTCWRPSWWRSASATSPTGGWEHARLTPSGTKGTLNSVWMVIFPLLFVCFCACLSAGSQKSYKVNWGHESRWRVEKPL